MNQLKDVACRNFVQFIFTGSNDADINISCLFQTSEKRNRSRFLKNGDIYCGEAINHDVGKQVISAMVQEFDNLHTNGKKSHQFVNSSFHDHLHYNHLASDLIASVLIEKQIESVVFLNSLKHLNYVLLYQVAEALDIETLILTQSPFPNNFFSLRSITDCGNLAPLPSGQLVEPLKIESRNSPTCTNLRNSRQQSKKFDGFLTMREILWLCAFLLATDPLKLLQPSYILKRVRRIHRIPNSFSEWRDPFARFFHVERLAYFESLLDSSDRVVDLNRKFVYFPLQSHREIQIDFLGGRYADQLLAIEQLARMAPENYMIYVKDSSKQNLEVQSPMFFHRLRRIRKVCRLPSYASSDLLTDKAEFVATVSSTIGWEAICKGKNVLVFGIPWYRNMPGAIAYRENIKFEDICNSKIDHSNLERHTGWLVSNAHVGVIDFETASRMEKVDLEVNAQKVVDTLLNILIGRISTTFQPLERGGSSE